MGRRSGTRAKRSPRDQLLPGANRRRTASSQGSRPDSPPRARPITARRRPASGAVILAGALGGPTSAPDGRPVDAGGSPNRHRTASVPGVWSNRGDVGPGGHPLLKRVGRRVDAVVCPSMRTGPSRRVRRATTSNCWPAWWTACPTRSSSSAPPDRSCGATTPQCACSNGRSTSRSECRASISSIRTISSWCSGRWPACRARRSVPPSRSG